MKKIAAVTIGVLLIGSLFSQTTFSVYEKLIIQDGDTVTVESDLTDVSFKRRGVDKIMLTLENRKNNIETKVKHKLVSLYTEFLEYTRGGGYMETEDTCHGKINEIGRVIIHDNDPYNGSIKIDRDMDGTFEEIYVLKSCIY